MRWIRRGLIGLMLILVAAAVAAWVYAQRASPRVDGALVLPGAQAPIVIERDAHDLLGDALDLGHVHAETLRIQQELQDLDFIRPGLEEDLFLLHDGISFAEDLTSHGCFGRKAAGIDRFLAVELQ